MMTRRIRRANGVREKMKNGIVNERGQDEIVLQKLRKRRIIHIQGMRNATRQIQNLMKIKNQKLRRRRLRVRAQHLLSLKQIIIHLSEKLAIGSDCLRSCREERRWKARVRRGRGEIVRSRLGPGLRLDG